MSEADRYQRAKTIFLEACELPAVEVAAYLSSACDGDSGLRRDVESMLHEDGRGGDLLDQRAPDGEGAAPALKPGTPIGRYRIVGVIGEGGMGIVYEAEQENPRRTVALKVIRPGLASPSMLRRFEHEAQALARLQHPGIAQIHEAGRAEGPPGWGGRVAFFAMERVRGTPLLEYGRQKELTTRQRLELGARIADAVQHAHQRGVIHRDLKPANILVDESGQPKVLDFGIARVTDEQRAATVLTSAGQIIGTVAYMSPEQAAGDPGAIDTRSDLYSLGVVLYELLTGRLPYPVSGVMLHEALRVIGQADPVRISAIDRRLRGDVATIIMRALEKDRTRRYQAGAELAEDLRRYLRDEPILAQPPTAFYQLRKFARRNKAMAAGTVIAAAAMVIGTAVSLRQAAVAVAARKVADEKTSAAERQAARATFGAAALAIEGGDAITARRLLDSVDESRRGWEWRHKSSQLDSSSALFEFPDPIAAATVGAGGAEAIVATSPGTIRRRRLDGGPAADDVKLDGVLTGPAVLSADGSRLAAICGDKKNQLGLWDTATGTRLASLETSQKVLKEIAITRAGDRVAASGAGALLWDPASGEVTPFNGGEPVGLAFSGDGSRVASIYSEWRYYREYDARTGKTLGGPHHSPAGDPGDIALNDDGSFMLLGTLGKNLWLERPNNNTRVREFKGNVSGLRTVRFEPGGGRVLGAGLDGAVRVWSTTTGDMEATLFGHLFSVAKAGFAPGSRVWAVSNKTLRVWDLLGRDETDVLRGHQSYVYALAALDGGRRVASGAWDKTLRVWDAATGESLATAPCAAGVVFALAAIPAAPGRPSMIITAHSPALFGVWNALTLEHLRDVHTAHSGRSISLATSGDGALLAVRLNTGVEVFRTSDWQCTASFDLASPSYYSAVALSPDGSLLAADGPGAKITLWNLRGSQPPTQLTDHRGSVYSLKFSPDGRTLASGSADSTVRLWDATTWRPLRTLTGHTDSVFALAYSPDGSRLASGSNDTSVRLWDIPVGEPAAVLRGHNEYVFALAFVQDGATLLSGSGDSTVRLWSTEPAHARVLERAAMSRRREEVRPMVEDLFARLGEWSAVAEAVRADTTLDSLRREAALEVVVGRAAAPAEPRTEP